MRFDLKSTREIASLAIILGITAFLLMYHLPYWPTTFYDEGMNLQTAKNLVRYGVYGVQSSEGFRLFDPLASTGPTVLVPVALAFKLFGIGITQARMVMVFFEILALISIYFLTRHVFDTKTALVALLLTLGIPLFLVDDSASFLGLGRYVLGEIPTLLFLTVGCLLWFKALNFSKNSLLMGAGAFWGLALITKDYSLLIIAILVLIWVVDRLRYHQLQWKQVAIPIGISIAILLIWILLQTYLKSLSTNENNPILYGIITRAFIGLIDPSQIISNIRVLLASGILIWGLPGLVYGVYLSKERTLLGLKRVFLLIFSMIWLIWFVLGSIGWMRYAIVGICLMLIFTARLFVDLSSGLVSSFKKPDKTAGEEWITKERIQKLAVVLVLAILVITPLQEKAKQIISASDATPYEFASYISTEVDTEAVIESFEPEIVFLADNNFHQPSHYVVFKAIRHAQFGESYPPDILEQEKIIPSYLVQGTMSEWTGLYNEWIESGKYVLVKTVGEYDLYQAVDQAK